MPWKASKGLTSCCCCCVLLLALGHQPRSQPGYENQFAWPPIYPPSLLHLLPSSFAVVAECFFTGSQVSGWTHNVLFDLRPQTSTDDGNSYRHKKGPARKARREMDTALSSAPNSWGDFPACKSMAPVPDLRTILKRIGYLRNKVSDQWCKR